MHFSYTSVNFKIIPNFVVIISNSHWGGRGFMLCSMNLCLEVCLTYMLKAKQWVGYPVLL